jgi:hypothetical protein
MTKKEIREEIVFAVEQKLVPTMAYFMEKYHSEKIDYVDIAEWFAEECTTSAYYLADEIEFGEEEEDE